MEEPVMRLCHQLGRMDILSLLCLGEVDALTARVARCLAVFCSRDYPCRELGLASMPEQRNVRVRPVATHCLWRTDMSPSY